ncbi:Cryptochrome/DNA photolyase class 1 [Macrophomina phaseolina MS6]|uniref:Cryptochrome/DNA photolyase class 1 n=1 Tax=Macrophomina phaseolina (strain MS6) TaxID=1126212 RepID=K2REH0_MACPH|nr:Cryptochrome/DNA photolyase class 1 [Macrophomina phaseolina MS6]
MPAKRKAPPASIGYSDATGNASNKRSAESHPSRKAIKRSSGTPDDEKRPANQANGVKDWSSPEFDHTRAEERAGIVQREYYPAEMSNERCAQYNNNEIPRPIELLEQTIKSTKSDRGKIKHGAAVVHWFKRDLRLRDNVALSLAAKKAKDASIPLICVFIVSPQDYEAHFTGAPRVDFDLRTLAILQHDLAALDIPLVVETVPQRKNVPQYLIDKCTEWGAAHLFCNMEYEVDELRREKRLIERCLAAGVDCTVAHDDVVVPPGALQTGAGKQYAVYTPWFRAWVAHVHKHPELLDERPPPAPNPKSAREKFKHLFGAEMPEAPEGKRLEPEMKERLAKLWPAGEHEAQERLDKFLESRAAKYKDSRNFPAKASTAMLSVHHSAGTLAARTSVRRAKEANSSKKLDGGNAGIAGWISEVAWRDFYKHVLAHWPYVCMFKPFKYEYTNVEWEYNDDHFARWTTGQTGFPIVDAAMRQMANTAYMHNRCRMIVASFLAKDLLLDWRLGERHFMENLVDGDFASNNGGWGFAASVGVDPQPYFRIFNPLLQSEKFDPDGEYIRKWVPELRDVKGKAVHDPYGRGAGEAARKKGYPEPMVDHKSCRERALKRYKEGIGRETA